jgi:hypothetical protein
VTGQLPKNQKEELKKSAKAIGEEFLELYKKNINTNEKKKLELDERKIALEERRMKFEILKYQFENPTFVFNDE